MIDLLCYYLISINIIAFIVYGIDKWKAKYQKWRISEAYLLCLAMTGGALGAYIGMQLFHHKTKHKKFIFLVPLFLLLWLVGLIYFSVETFR